MKRFLNKVEKTETCWLWTAATRKNGYGQFNFEGRIQKAHRVSYQLFVGEIPEDMHVLHKCDVRRCVRPDHLFLGTHSENVSDMVYKGRHQYGETHADAKLTEKKVLAIRADPRQHQWGGRTKIARDYGVSNSLITHIIQRDKWKHLDEAS